MCIHVCTYTYIIIYKHAHTYTYIYICVKTHTHTYICIYIHILYIHIYIYIYSSALHTYNYTHIYIYTYINIYVYMYPSAYPPSPSSTHSLFSLSYTIASSRLLAPTLLSCCATLCVSWLTQMSAMKHSHVWHHPCSSHCRCVLTRINTLVLPCYCLPAMTHSYLWKNLLLRVSWRIHMCICINEACVYIYRVAKTHRMP